MAVERSSSGTNDPGMEGGPARSDPLRDPGKMLVFSSAWRRSSYASNTSTAAAAAAFDAASIFASCCCNGSSDVGPYRNVASSMPCSLMTSDWSETCDKAVASESAKSPHVLVLIQQQLTISHSKAITDIPQSVLVPPQYSQLIRQNPPFPTHACVIHIF